MRVEFHERAWEELRSARRWYIARSVDAYLSFANEFDRAIQDVVAAPLRWPEYLPGIRRYRLHRFPYHIVYQIEPDAVYILAVAHAQRRPGYWRKRR